MAVPNTFATATSAIPLANLDANFAYYDGAFSISGTATTFAGSVTLTSGTANGVTYLNGSKVLTSGSALTFDGTTFTNTQSGGAAQLQFNALTFTRSGANYITASNSTLNYLASQHVFGDNTLANEWMRLTSTGLGIGTSSPARPLEVVRGTVGFVSRRGYSSGQSIYEYTDATAVYISTGTNLYNAIGINETNSFVNFYTANAERMRIDSSGNVGIGTSSPSALLTLSSGSGTKAVLATTRSFTVNRNWQIAVDEYAEGKFFITPSTTLGGTTFTTPAVTVNYLGDVGIGTTSPTRRLSVVNTASGSPLIEITGIAGAGYELGFGVDNIGGFIQQTGAKPLQFFVNSSERMRIDSSGNLLVGTTTNTYSDKAVISGNLGIYAAQLNIKAGTSGVTPFEFVNRVGGGFDFYVNDAITLAARINASGNLLVGGVTAAVSESRFYGSGNLASVNGLGLNHTSASGTAYFGYFLYNSAAVGQITSTGTVCLFTSLSDYRLKENVQPMQNALAAVSQLKPVTYKWKLDGSDGEGFIAHELAEVFPHAVTGEKDALNEDGSIKPQGIDTSLLVATLTAAIQEQQALITSLTARITALEST